MYELEGCLYLIRKGFSLILTVEKRKSKQVLQRYRTMKIIDKEGNEVFDRYKHYEVITVNEKKELQINEKGYPIVSTQPIVRQRDEKGKLKKDRRSVRNDVVILHVVYNIMLHLEEDAEKHLIRSGTKLSKDNKVSKFQLKQIPFVNDNGVTEKYIDDNNYRLQECQLIHDILTCYFVKYIPLNQDTIPITFPVEYSTVYNIKYIIIGDQYEILYKAINDSEKSQCEVVTRDFFLQLLKTNMEIRMNQQLFLPNVNQILPSQQIEQFKEKD